MKITNLTDYLQMKIVPIILIWLCTFSLSTAILFDVNTTTTNTDNEKIFLSIAMLGVLFGSFYLFYMIYSFFKSIYFWNNGISRKTNQPWIKTDKLFGSVEFYSNNSETSDFLVLDDQHEVEYHYNSKEVMKQKQLTPFLKNLQDF